MERFLERGESSKRSRTDGPSLDSVASKDKVWNHFFVSGKTKAGLHAVKCKYCDSEFSLRPNRARAHLGHIPKNDIAFCKNVPPDVKASFQPEQASVCVTRAGTSSQSNPSSTLFGTQGHSAVDDSICEFIIDNALPFNLVTSASFKKLLVNVAKWGQNYKPPGKTKVSTVLLDRLHSRVDQELVEVRSCIEVFGAALCSDGYTNHANQAYYNCILTSPCGNEYYGLIVGSADKKNALWIADNLTAVINRYGAEHIVIVVMDNAAVNVAAGNILMERFPYITFVGCCAHAIDLLIKDAYKHPWAADLFDQALR